MFLATNSEFCVQVYLSKLAIELLSDAEDKDDIVAYEDFLCCIESAPMTPEGRRLSEEDVLNAADFIVQQVHARFWEPAPSGSKLKLFPSQVALNSSSWYSLIFFVGPFS